ncbi:MAG: spore cortex biosynthesis protein YabQ [Clostridia bacterium]|nr:spore cortex biosynthesis protein YabQ [Clostridia bacterium]
MAQNQAYLFLVFSITGVVIGVLFDFFRILRKTIKTPNIITYIQDISFWILTGLIILYNIWFFNDGEIRIYMFLGIIIGILIYMSTLSKLVIFIFLKILQIIIKILEIPFKTIKLILKKISTLIVKIFAKFTKIFANKKGKIENYGE